MDHASAFVKEPIAYKSLPSVSVAQTLSSLSILHARSLSLFLSLSLFVLIPASFSVTIMLCLKS